MLVGLVCAAGTSLCYGAGSVLQAMAASAADGSAPVSPRLLLRVMGAWRYLVGLALDAIGFLLALAALRTLPLYVVQSVVASSLAVTAVLGALVLRTRLDAATRAALVLVVAGLGLVSLSAAPETATEPARVLEWLLLVLAGLLVLACVPLASAPAGRSAGALGAVAGLAFGVVAVSARLLWARTTHGSLGSISGQLLVSPASYALLGAAPLGLAAYAIALQRGSVVQATAPLVVGETVLPAIVGIALLGDHPRPGWTAPAVAGLVLATAAAVMLSRFGEVAPVPARTLPAGSVGDEPNVL